MRDIDEAAIVSASDEAVFQAMIKDEIRC